jgi:transcriptional regulator with XRE-family HTH domain
VIEAPSARRLLIGAALRRYREDLGFILEDAARVLECDRSKISRIETGQRGIRPKELRELLTEYGVSEREQSTLTAIARAGSRGSGEARRFPTRIASTSPWSRLPLRSSSMTRSTYLTCSRHRGMPRQAGSGAPRSRPMQNSACPASSS